MQAVAQSAPAAIPQAVAADRVEESPLLVFVETTRACDLACARCSRIAEGQRHRRELSTADSKALLDDLARFARLPLVVLSGGDPMKRGDLAGLVAHGAGRGLTMALMASSTPLVTRDALSRLADSGLSRLSVGLDGATAGSHDSWRGVRGSFDKSLEILSDARDSGLSVQVCTTVHRGNADELPQMAGLLEGSGIASWSLSFLVPVDGLPDASRIPAEKYEEVFALLSRQSKRRSFVIRTMEAPHYGRFLMQQRHRGADASAATASAGAVGRAAVQDGGGALFVASDGSIQPGGFLPLVCGRFPDDSVVDVYQRHPLLRALRNRDGLRGKCGACEFRRVCGGSRARAFAVSGDPLASDPDCAWLPRGWKRPTLRSVGAARA